MIVRHAKSDWSEDVPDAERPLAGRGRREAPAIGRWLRAHVGAIDLVVRSPAVRVRQTWELAVAELDAAPRVIDDERVYAATADDLLTVVRALPDDTSTVVLVGHNPGVQDLVTLLSGEPCELKTSALAVLSRAGSWAGVGPGGAVLEAQATPRK